MSIGENAYPPGEGSGADRVRKTVRYWLARIRNQETGGCPAEGCPEGLRERFESMPMFGVAGGWKGYRVNWDVGPKGEEMIGLEKSEWEAWYELCMANAKELPVKQKPEVIKVDRPGFDQSGEIEVRIEGS